MRNTTNDFLKIAITNRHLCEGTDVPHNSRAYSKLLQQIERLDTSEYNRIVLREKDLSEDEYYDLAKQVIEVVSSKPLYIHNFYQVAIKLGIKNIHLPLHILEKAATEDAATLDYFDEIGTSVHSIEDVKLAEQLGATYVFAGHVFVTDCKKGLPGRGIPWLQSIVNAVSIPVYAIGGISEDKLADVQATGAQGACFMSEAMKY